MTNWLIDWLLMTVWLTDWLTYWWTDWLTEWLIDYWDWLTDWLTECPTDWLFGWPTDRLTMLIWNSVPVSRIFINFPKQMYGLVSIIKSNVWIHNMKSSLLVLWTFVLVLVFLSIFLLGEYLLLSFVQGFWWKIQISWKMNLKIIFILFRTKWMPLCALQWETT